MRSPAATSWTWRPPPMFGSAPNWRSTPLWRSACSTRSHPRRQSPQRRSRHRNGRHLRLPDPRRLRCRSPAPVRSTARLISRRDPAGLGPRVAIGDRALDELAGDATGPRWQFLLLRRRQASRSWVMSPVPNMSPPTRSPRPQRVRRGSVSATGPGRPGAMPGREVVAPRRGSRAG